MQEFTYNVKCVLSYDGSNYMGFQIQPGLLTIESELKRVLKLILKSDVKIYGSGRTDKGVHALGQVFNFYTNIYIPEERFIYAFNRQLPKDIHILSLEYVPLDFHARFSAIKKEYRYYIKTKNYSVFDQNYMHYDFKLDESLMEDAIPLFKGRHQFEGFCSMEVDKRKDFYKTIYEAKMIRHEDFLEFVFVGSGFLKYQIRRMMGILIAIGHKDCDKSLILKILESHDPTLFTKVAPGCGLYLVKVWY